MPSESSDLSEQSDLSSEDILSDASSDLSDASSDPSDASSDLSELSDASSDPSELSDASSASSEPSDASSDPSDASSASSEPSDASSASSEPSDASSEPSELSNASSQSSEPSDASSDPSDASSASSEPSDASSASSDLSSLSSDLSSSSSDPPSSQSSASSASSHSSLSDSSSSSSYDDHSSSSSSDPLRVEITAPADGKAFPPGDITFQGQAYGGCPPYMLDWHFDSSLQANPANATQDQTDEYSPPEPVVVNYPEAGRGQKGKVTVYVTDSLENTADAQIDIWIPDFIFKEISFTSAQDDLYYGGILYSSSKMEAPQYTDEGKNDSFCHTLGTPTECDVTIEVIPDDTPAIQCTVEASGEQGFEYVIDATLNGGSNNLSGTSASQLPSELTILEPNVEWEIYGSTWLKKLAFWKKKAYLLPAGNYDDNFHRTEARLEWIIGVVGNTQDIGAAADLLYDEVNDQFGSSNPSNLWTIANGSSANCNSICGFIKMCLDMIGLGGSQVKYLFARIGKTVGERNDAIPLAGDMGFVDNGYTLNQSTYPSASQNQRQAAYNVAGNLFEAVVIVNGSYYAPGLARGFQSAQAVLDALVAASIDPVPDVVEWW